MRLTEYKMTLWSSSHGENECHAHTGTVERSGEEILEQSVSVIVWLFVLMLTSQVNSYGHGETVSSPNHTFSWASLNKQLTSTLRTYFRL